MAATFLTWKTSSISFTVHSPWPMKDLGILCFFPQEHLLWTRDISQGKFTSEDSI